MSALIHNEVVKSAHRAVSAMIQRNSVTSSVRMSFRPTITKTAKDVDDLVNDIIRIFTTSLPRGVIPLPAAFTRDANGVVTIRMAIRRSRSVPIDNTQSR